MNKNIHRALKKGSGDKVVQCPVTQPAFVYFSFSLDILVIRFDFLTLTLRNSTSIVKFSFLSQPATPL